MKKDWLYIKRRLDIEKTFHSCGVKSFQVSSDLVVTWRGVTAVMLQDIKCVNFGYWNFVENVFTIDGKVVRDIDLHKVENIEVLIENGVAILCLSSRYNGNFEKKGEWRKYIELKY